MKYLGVKLAQCLELWAESQQSPGERNKDLNKSRNVQMPFDNLQK